MDCACAVKRIVFWFGFGKVVWCFHLGHDKNISSPGMITIVNASNYVSSGFIHKWDFWGEMSSEPQKIYCHQYCIHCTCHGVLDVRMWELPGDCPLLNIRWQECFISLYCLVFWKHPFHISFWYQPIMPETWVNSGGWDEFRGVTDKSKFSLFMKWTHLSHMHLGTRFVGTLQHHSQGDPYDFP